MMNPTTVNSIDIQSERPAVSHKLDKLGIAASVACAVHCLIAPFLLLLLPAAGAAWSHPSVHWVLAALVLPLALIVVYRGYRQHRRRTALIAAVLGTLFIVLGLVVPNNSGSGGGTPTAAGLEHEVTAEGETCTESCCPSISQNPDTGAFSFSFPAASILTMIGSVFLVLAHGINLHGCYCFSRKRDSSEGSCGCPTECDNKP